MTHNHLEIICGDALTELRKLPSESVHCCVTSPPYWGLRDYGTAEWQGGEADCNHKDSNQTRGNIPGTKQATNNNGEGGTFADVCGRCGAKRIDSQLGLEATPELYVAKMVEVFREVRRVLRKDGTLWLNLGDSYAQQRGGTSEGSHDGRTGRGEAPNYGSVSPPPGLKPKDLIGIPWRVAFALQADGWYLRSDIIWAKPNPMPESVTDRPTKAHEYIFLLTKSARYFYDAEAIKEQSQPSTLERGQYGWNGKMVFDENGNERRSQPDPVDQMGDRWCATNRNKRSVWTVATAPFSDWTETVHWRRVAEDESVGGTRRIVLPDSPIGFHYRKTSEMSSHFATYPPDLIKPCILAGTKCGDVVLDPFAGSGTTGAVALELGRSAILIELNPAYVQLIRSRCNVTLGLPLA